MILSKLQKQFIEDLLKEKNDNKIVIIAKYYIYSEKLVIYEWTVGYLKNLSLDDLLSIVIDDVGNKKIKYLFETF